MLRSIFMAVAMLFANVPAAARTADKGDLQLVDLTGETAQALAKSAGEPAAQRVAALKARFTVLLPGFYSERFGPAAQSRYDQRLARGINDFAELQPGASEVSRRFSTMFEPALSTFEKSFGPMKGYPPIYLVYSFGEFDGGTRQLSGKNILLFGADVIAQLHMSHDIRPFFHHELFHLYHARYFPECESVWCGLWAEGLATYVAAQLNPMATDAELLLTQPEPLRAAVEAHRSEAICEVHKRLESTRPEDMNALFSSGRLSPNLPPRFGYYIGYLAASELGRTHSMTEMAQLSPAKVLPELAQTLQKLGHC